MPDVRRANSEDIESITALWKEMMSYHISLDSVYEMRPDAERLFREYALANISDTKKRVFVCCEAESIIGYAFAGIYELAPVYIDTRIGEVDSISVAAGSRRKGVGRKLAEECERWFTDNGIKRAECMVSVKNPLSQAFWKACGYAGYNKKCYKRLGR